MISQNLMTINMENMKERVILIKIMEKKIKKMANKILKSKNNTTKTIPQNTMVKKNIMVKDMEDFILLLQLLCLYLLQVSFQQLENVAELVAKNIEVGKLRIEYQLSSRWKIVIPLKVQAFK